MQSDCTDYVVSEVNTFSSRKLLNFNDDGSQSCAKVSVKTENYETADTLFTCILGDNGEIVLWNEKSESMKLNSVLSRFDFTFPNLIEVDPCENKFIVSQDKDGDFEVPRKSNFGQRDGILLIEHQSATSLDLVGEQVWRGAFYLSDFILDNWDKFEGLNVVEVASGVGLTSLVASMMAKKVVATDVDRGNILNLIKRNFDRNNELISACTYVKEFDFFDLLTLDELSSFISDADVFLAADVVYNDTLTDAFFDCLKRLMRPNRTFYIALEKRYVFTIEDLDTVAPCYEHFLTNLQNLKNSCLPPESTQKNSSVQSTQRSSDGSTQKNSAVPSTSVEKSVVSSDKALNQSLNLNEKSLNLNEESFNLNEDTLNLNEKSLNLNEESFNLNEESFNLNEDSLNLNEKSLNLTEKSLNLTIESLNSTQNSIDLDKMATKNSNLIPEMSKVANKKTHLAQSFPNSGFETGEMTWNVELIPQSDITQYFSYERTKELVLWKISCTAK